MQLPNHAQVRALVERFDSASFVPERDAYELMQALYDHGFILRDFDWPRWDEGRANSGNLVWISQLDLETLCKLFTAHARSDRFCENHWEAVCSSGVISAMLKRLAEVTR